jgi:hypothetical protein
MAPEHVLQHNGRVSAIMDFAGVQVSDPAEDLAPLLAASAPDVAETIVAAYRSRRPDLEDPHLEDRAALLAELAVIRWLLHGVRHGDQAIVEDARGMLRDLDQAVGLEQKELARLAEAAAAAEAEAHARLEAAKRASAAAAREHLRTTTGALPILHKEADQADGQATAVIRLSEVAPERVSVAREGVSMWGKAPASVPSWDDPDLEAAATPPPDLDEAAPPGDDEPTPRPKATTGRGPRGVGRTTPRGKPKPENPDDEPGAEADQAPRASSSLVDSGEMTWAAAQADGSALTMSATLASRDDSSDDADFDTEGPETRAFDAADLAELASETTTNPKPRR